VRPPEIGEHTDEILKEFGYGDAEIAGFRARGVI
jgi:crotonobetainyl-CoA:carnitine CoA-transferase CaiB-like acyl-CoA transferase